MEIFKQVAEPSMVEIDMVEIGMGDGYLSVLRIKKTLIQTMGWSTEAVLALVTIFITALSPLLPIVWKCMKRRHTRSVTLKYKPGTSLSWTGNTDRELDLESGLCNQHSSRTSKWKYTCYKLRKRELQGKPSAVLKHDRKLDDKTVQKEISRNVSLTDMSTMDLDEDIPTPSDIQIVTPPPTNDELLCMRVRVDNLPWIQFKLEVQSIVWSGLALNLQLPVFTPGQTGGMLLPSLQPQDFLPDFNMIFQERSNLSNSRALQFASLLAPPRHNQNDGKETALSRFKSYLIDDPNDAASSVIMTSPDILHTDSLDMSTLLNLFVFLSTNNVLYRSQVDKGLSWIIENIDLPTITRFSHVKSLTMKIFLGKLFLSAVSSRNQQIARVLIRAGVDVNTISTSWVHESSTALGIAVRNGDIEMVQLLCEAGAALALRYHDIGQGFRSQASLWHPDKIDILRLLLSLGANPETFIADKIRGFPLSDAASEGALEAVYLLLYAGANANRLLFNSCRTALQAAAENGHYEVALALVYAGADVNLSCIAVDVSQSHNANEASDDSSIISQFYCPSRQTPIELATKKNHTGLVKALLRSGAKAGFCPVSSYYIAYGVEEWSKNDAAIKYVMEELYEQKDSFATAIQYAVQNQNLELVSLLLSHGAHVDSRVAPTYGDTPLQIAARVGNIEIANFLLEHGADINASAAKFNGRTAIQAAAESGNLELCDMLLKYGAGVNAPAAWSEGLTAIQAALLRGHIDVARFLHASGADVHAAAGHVAGLTALQAAASHGDIDILKEILGTGARANAPAAPIIGRTALSAAVYHENIQLLQVLLLGGADVNGQSSTGCTALLSAVRIRWRDGVEYLLRCRADPNLSPCCPENEETSYLPEDEVETDRDMLALLLANGADPNLPTSCHEGGSPDALYIALKHSYPAKFITLLLNAGAAVNSLRDDESALPIAVAGSNPSIETVQMILDETARLPYDFYTDQVSKAWQAINRMTEHVTELIDILLKAGAHIDTRDRRQGETLLQKVLALKFSDPVTANFIIEKGANLDVPSTEYTGTPLQEAIKNKLTDLVYMILEHDVDINAPPARKRGATALQAAALTGQLPIARELLERGADVAAPAAEEDGRTAIDGAAEHGRLDMLQLLLNAYGDREDLSLICHNAAKFAQKENHMLIAEWLRGYRHS
ncbi:hypothetical protein MW887_004541 [Aspergillus wentii]|nr:hypothetical protein MW887_004541 [Aspergillus wentii]